MEGILIKILGNSEHSLETQNTCNEAWQMSPGLSFFQDTHCNVLSINELFHTTD